jgi:hypothetical protein
MSIPELEKQLAQAQGKVKQLQGSRAELAEWHAAYESLASAQRALAAAKGEEYAAPHDIGFEPEAAVSEPVLLQTDDAAILTFSAVRVSPDRTREDAGYGIVEIDQCSQTKFGYPNDEALPGHPLYERGLCAYGVYEVRNSSWVRLMTKQNRVAFPNTPDSTQRHFIFTFHDNTFECVARGLRASLSARPYAEIFEEVRKRVFKRDGDVQGRGRPEPNE